MLKILIVDDAPDDGVLAERVLRRAKVLNPIHVLNSGDECVHYFREHGCFAGSNAHACIVFLDMMMQPTDGLAVLRTLKKENLAGDSIIVMLSGNADLKAIQEGYRLGARTFLEKPFKPQDVADVLKSLETRISVRRSRDGKILHWVSAPSSEQSGDTDFIRRSATPISESLTVN
jgi:two-component system response regulator